MNLSDFIVSLKLPFRKNRELYRSLYSILGFYPHDIRLYQQALSHKSSGIRGEHGHRINNERLEFLGDAILDAVVGDIVFHHFRTKQEGFLTNTRSKIVQRDMLNKIAVEVGLDKLFRSNGRAQETHNSYVLGNAFEALVGAVYLDRGFRHCKRFMEKQVLKHLINIDKVAYKEVNFKSKLLEWAQKNKLNVEFTLVDEKMEAGSTPTFVSQVTVEGVVCGKAKGYSKKESQQRAAKEALVSLKKKSDLERQVFDAKGKRTAMEEEPQALLPEIPGEPSETTEQRKDKKTEEVEIDFSSVGQKQKAKTRDDIIAEAEEKAFAEE